MGDPRLARYGAPVAFLLAVTVAVLLVRSALNGADSPALVPATTVQDISTPTTTATTTAKTTTSATDTTAAEYYEIQRGDTLAAVAARYSTSVEALLTMNEGLDPVALQIGQRVRVK